jgi:cobalt-zinc-cadmium efflux system membrane fusion protein
MRDLSAHRSLSRTLLAGALLLLLGAAFWAVHRASLASETAPASVADKPVPPGTFRPTRSQLEGLTVVKVVAANFRGEQTTDGTVATNDDATTPVYSPYSGRVAKLFAKPGEFMQKGAPLMSVEASEFVQGQSDLVAALSAAASARAQVVLTEAAEQRQHDLYLAKAGAYKDWLQSQSDLTAARATLRSAEIALGAARDRLRILGRSDEEITALEKEPGTRRLSSEAIVRSPIAGTVIQRQVGLGQYIQSAAAGASSPVYLIGNLSTAWLVANVRETEAAQLRVGQPVEVRVLAWPGRVFKAKISWIAAALDPSTHRLLVRAEVDNHDGALKPMMFGSFRILTGDAVVAPGVPQDAIVYEGAEAHVFVALDDGTLAIRPIHTGRTSGDLVEVTEGLAAGERVVTRGALFIDRATETR